MKEKKRIHLISNAHIDPMWQWDWQEGAACSISTFRTAADFCEEYDGYVFNHNEALLYKWIEEYEVELFERIVKLVKAGKWHIMGGWYIQPDCNMPSGEALVRQISYGRKYFKEKFNVEPKTAVNVDSFGHSRGLVQILRKGGYDSYLHIRPSNDKCPLEADTYKWLGYDGSFVYAHRASFYNTGLGNVMASVESELSKFKDEDIVLVMWGVGNHGGGPSRLDLEALEKYKGEEEKKGIEVIHSTPETYFKEVIENKKDLPVHDKDLNYFAVGCYTSQVRIKQKYRELENMYFQTEAMCVNAYANGLMAYPKEELDKALEELLLAAFHDYLPGTCTKPVEETCLQKMGYGLEILSKIRTRAFFALSKTEEKAKEGSIPILVYNPHPFEIEEEIECEFMMWDQNWTKTFNLPVVYKGDKALPSQGEKENSTIPIDWRKKVIFRAKLAPMRVNSFECRFKRLDEKPIPTINSSTSHFLFDNGKMKIKINKRTGLIDECKIDGISYLKEGAFSLEVMDDDYDPWGMNVFNFTKKLGNFSLMSASEGSKYSYLKSAIPSLRVIEDGDVRTVVEGLFSYQNSKAVIRYYLPKAGSHFDIDIKIDLQEKQKMIKLAIPTDFIKTRCTGEVPYGRETLPCNMRENVQNRYNIFSESKSNRAIGIINRGIYGSSVENSCFKLSLVRSPSYTAHPLPERETMPQDRHMDYIDLGERTFKIRICAGDLDYLQKSIGKEASIFNDMPFSLSFFPPGQEGEKPKPALIVGDSPVEIRAFFLEDVEYVIRLFNPLDEDQEIELSMPIIGIKEKLKVKAFEFITYRVPV